MFRFRRALVVSLALVLAILASYAADASIICNDYGDCTICDFYDSNGRWIGYVSNCKPSV